MAYNQMKHDPNEELHQAIENLHIFVEQNNDSSIPTIYQLDVKDGHLVAQKPNRPLEKVIDLSCCLFGLAFSNHSRYDQLQKKDKINQALIKAVAFVSSHYPLIEKLKKGSLDEQRFAEGAIDIIHRYNAVISKKVVYSQSSWTSRFAAYIYRQSQMTLDDELKKTTIILPQSASYESDSSLSSKKISQRSLSNSAIPHQNFSNIQPSQHEVDAFRMKAITLINKHQIPSSIQEAVYSLKGTPITIESETIERQETSPSAIISLHQILTPFPGEVIKLTGSFKRTPHAALLSTPIPESFRVSSQSTQTAFPHPLQNNGWALSDVLIPNYPLRPDQLPLFNRLAEKKREAAYALLPKGHLRNKAKQLIELKRLAFEKDSEAFLDLHKTLGRALLSAADASSEENIKMVDRFYVHVKEQTQVYDYLAGIYQIIEDKCLTSLYRRLHHEWLEAGNPSLRGNNDQLKYDSAAALLKDESCIQLAEINGMDSAPEVSNFITYMGQLIGQATQSIILQSMSEKIGFPPPMLNDFEQKIQSCAINQVMTFLTEIESSEISETNSNMKTMLMDEITLFQAPSFDELSSVAPEISNELEIYFNTRFYARK